MKTTTGLAVICGALFSLAGCDHGAEEHGHAAHTSEAAGHEDAAKLTLNNGEKWQTDEHTRQAAARLVARVEKTATIRSQQDARGLAEDLDKELQTLVQGCTMGGKAHDQLHVFLMALFPEVASLKEQTELKELAQTRERISSLFAAYNKHFE